MPTSVDTAKRDCRKLAEAAAFVTACARNSQLSVSGQQNRDAGEHHSRVFHAKSSQLSAVDVGANLDATEDVAQDDGPVHFNPPGQVSDRWPGELISAF